MPAWATTNWAYLRFHAGRARPASCYSERALEGWVERIRDLWGPDPSGYAYFNNDHMGCALRDAAVLGRLLEGKGMSVARRPDISDEVLHLRPVGA